MKPAHDRSKLPVWAQRELERLERDLEYNRAKLRQGPEDSVAFAEPYSDAPRPLGPDPHIEFHVGGGKVQVSIKNDALNIMGMDGILVAPQAGNVIRVIPTRFR